MKTHPKVVDRILDALRDAKTVCIIGHIRPDGDCVGSQLALTLALLVAPPTTALLFVRRVPRVMGVGAAIGAASGIAGLYLSYYLDVASGAAIVLVAIAFFLLALLATSYRKTARRRSRA